MNKYLRLKKLKEYIKNGAYLLDVGTDHGILPEMCYEENLCKKIIASDISEKSLDKLRNKIEFKNMDIETYVTDGLNNLNIKDIDTITISGMGGHLIVEILNERINELEDKRLILSPQGGVSHLREFLIKKNFNIIHEDMVYEDDKYYNIIVSEYGNLETYSYKEYIFGKIDKYVNKDILFDKLRHEKEVREDILNNIGTSKNAQERKKTLEEEIKLIKEVLNVYQ